MYEFHFQIANQIVRKRREPPIDPKGIAIMNAVLINRGDDLNTTIHRD